MLWTLLTANSDLYSKRVKVFLRLYAPYYETNIAYSETTKLYGGEEQLAIDDSAQIPIRFTFIFHHVGRKETVPHHFK